MKNHHNLEEKDKMYFDIDCDLAKNKRDNRAVAMCCTDSELVSEASYGALIGAGDENLFTVKGYANDCLSVGDCGEINIDGFCNTAVIAGDCGTVSVNGNSTDIAVIGQESIIKLNGDTSRIYSSGNEAHVEINGNNVVFTSIGDNCTASTNGVGILVNIGEGGAVKGKIGTWITLAEYDSSSGSLTCVRSEMIDGEKLKEDTWYSLVDGEIVECDPASIEHEDIDSIII